MFYGGRRVDESYWYVYIFVLFVNNIIGNRVLKIWYYGVSESNNFRLVCVVSKNNFVYNDVLEVSIVVCCFRKLYKCFKLLNRDFENFIFCKINRIKKKDFWVLLKRRLIGYIIILMNVLNCEWLRWFDTLENDDIY